MAGIVTDLTNTPAVSSPDCYARIIHFKRRDTRDYFGKRPKYIPIEGDHGARHGVGLNEEQRIGATYTDVSSDILSCMIQKTKSAVSGTFTMVLAPGRVNYHHLVHPGDHIFIWMRRNRLPIAPLDANGHLAKKLTGNDRESGLKLYGVVTGIRKEFSVSPEGVKTLRYTVSGNDFGHFFESEVYYNQWIAEQLKKDAVLFSLSLLGISSVGGDNSDPDKLGGWYSPNKLVTAFMTAYLGKGPEIRELGEFERPVTWNKQLFVPKAVFETLNTSGQTFADLLVKRAGVESYEGDAIEPAPTDMPGLKQLTIDIGTRFRLWDTLQAYANLAINEMFVDLKPHKEGDKWMLLPTFTLRQIPFSTKTGALGVESNRGLKATRFVELPRVRIPESFIMREDTGRTDLGRFNFIEMFGTVPGADQLEQMMVQMWYGNYSVDTASINRYALRTMITQTDYLPAFDPKKPQPNIFQLVPGWVELLTDWWMGAHIYENGTFQTVGIEEPVSIGDNLEVVRSRGVAELYHIEGYQHVYGVTSDGRKMFRTNLTLTRGQRIDELPIYASAQIGPDDITDIGISQTEFEGAPAVQRNVQNLDKDEQPNRRVETQSEGEEQPAVIATDTEVV